MAGDEQDRKPLRSSRGKLKHLADTLGDVDPNAPTFTHDPTEEPADCLRAALHELADAQLTPREREDTLDHGLTALRELERRAQGPR